jgi:hypothetical protein
MIYYWITRLDNNLLAVFETYILAKCCTIGTNIHNCIGQKEQ